MPEIPSVKTPITASGPSAIQQVDESTPSKELKSQAAAESPKHIDADEVIVGAGPFGASYLEETANLEKKFGTTLAALRDHQDVGKRKVVVIDKTPLEDWGRGTPWLSREHGSMNTGAEAGYQAAMTKHLAANHEAYTDPSNAQSAPVRALLNAAVIRGSKEKPDTSQAFASRAQAGEEAARRFEAAVVKLEASENIDLVRIPEATVTNVKLNATGDQKARVTIAPRAGEPQETIVDGKDVFLATGTNEVNSVSAAVKEHAFVQAMNTDDLREFLRAKGCIDDDGLLKEDTKLLLGGLGLSNRDALTVVSNLMGKKVIGSDGSTQIKMLFKENADSPFGYEIDKKVAEKYQGAITIISARGTPLEPRFSHSPDCADIPKVWENGKVPLLSPSMQHALRLHRDGREAVCGTWNDLLKGCAAAAHETLPSKVGTDRDAEPLTLLAEQHDACEAHLTQVKRLAEAQARLKQADSTGEKEQAKRDIEEAKSAMNSHPNATYRKLALSTTLGLGCAANLTSGDKTKDSSITPSDAADTQSNVSAPMSEVDKLSERAPYTYAGRTGYSYLGAVMRSVTDLDHVEQYGNNKEFTDVWADNFMHVTASPPIIHSIAGKMSKEGVISGFQQNRYEAIQARPRTEEGRALKLETADETEGFDALVVSPAVRGLDQLELQLLQQSENPAERYANESFGEVLRDRSGTLVRLPSYTKDLQLIDKSGVESGVRPFGGLGKGVAAPRASDGTAGPLIASGRWDVNNRESAYDFSSQLAQCQQMKQILVAARVENPDQVLKNILDQIENPKEPNTKGEAESKAVQGEINSFATDYVQVKALQVFVKKAEEHAQKTVGAQAEAARLKELGTDSKSATEAQKKDAKDVGEKAAGREFSRLYLEGQTATGRLSFYNEHHIDVTSFEAFEPVKADDYLRQYANYTPDALEKAREKVMERVREQQ